MTLDLDPDRRLALAYVPAPRRAPRWRRSGVLTSLSPRSSPPAASRWSRRIRLAWWREALEAARPRARRRPSRAAGAGRACPAGRRQRRRAGRDGGGVGDPALRRAADRRRAGALCRAAGRAAVRLFRAAARRARISRSRRPGALWALVDLARHSSERDEVRDRRRAESQSPNWPRALRPLGMLAALARRDCGSARQAWERQGTSGADAAHDPPSAHRTLDPFWMNSRRFGVFDELR